MNVSIAAKVEKGYLFIEAAGDIFDSDEHKLLTNRFFDEIMKHRCQKIIIDVSNINFPNSFELLNDIVDYYVKELPPEIRSWKIAVVDESSFKDLGDFWEFRAKHEGYYFYKVFSTMEEAIGYITD